MIPKSRAIELLQRQRDLIKDLRSGSGRSGEFIKWKRDTEVAIEKIFGGNTRHLRDFRGISYRRQYVGIGSRPTEQQRRQDLVNGLNIAELTLESMIQEIEEYDDDQLEETLATGQDAIVWVEGICNRFHLVAQQLHHRHDSRPTLVVEDEYDVQDLLQGLLTLYFDDIRPEEWVPSYAGRASRTDFLLKQEKIVVEAKKTRKGLTADKIGEQLIIDIHRYRAHQDCRTLICFIYDPDGYIKNPRGIENDLSGQHDGLTVRVIISPKGV